MHRVPINVKIGRTRNNFSFLDLKVKATKGRVLITHFSFKIRTFDFVEGSLHLGNIQINLVFRSICTTFARKNRNYVIFVFFRIGFRRSS